MVIERKHLVSGPPVTRSWKDNVSQSAASVVSGDERPLPALERTRSQNANGADGTPGDVEDQARQLQEDYRVHLTEDNLTEEDLLYSQYR